MILNSATSILIVIVSNLTKMWWIHCYAHFAFPGFLIILLCWFLCLSYIFWCHVHVSDGILWFLGWVEIRIATKFTKKKEVKKQVQRGICGVRFVILFAVRRWKTAQVAWYKSMMCMGIILQCHEFQNPCRVISRMIAVVALCV